MSPAAPSTGPYKDGPFEDGQGGRSAFDDYGPGGDMLLPSEIEARRRRERGDRNLGRRVARAGGKAVVTRVQDMFQAGGAAFNVLANTSAAATAGDTLVAIALANTLFFSVPSSEARGNVALYLLITVAPFAVIGPLLGRVLDRPGAERFSLVSSSLLRLAAALALIPFADTLWLFPLAFSLLVLSRIFGIARVALLPVALDNPIALVTANARLAQVGVFAGAIAAPIGAGLSAFGPAPVLICAAAVYGLAAWQGLRLPDVGRPNIPPFDLNSPPGAADAPEDEVGAAGRAAAARVPEEPLTDAVRGQVRLVRFATSVVRLLNGFLVLILAFAFRDVDAPLADFGAVLAAAGGGFGLASLAAPRLERALREEPMVVAALAVEAAAAFLAGQFFGLPAAVALALAAGYAWGTAKFAFDGLLQALLPPSARGRAFTSSETMFQLAWVVGAVIPTGLTIDVHLGLPIAGVIALAAQTIYVSRLLQRA